VKQKALDTSESTFRSLVRTWGLFRGRMEPFFAQYGISGAQWGVLRQLQRAEAEDEGLTGLRLSDLGARLLVKPPSVTNLVDRVERMGLVTRRLTAGDRRTRHVALTSAGRKLVMSILKRRPSQVRSILAGLSEVEQCALHSLMEKLGTHLESIENARSSPAAKASTLPRRQNNAH
jgi:DNA-binding MarR family transcriptional regulator